MAKRLNNQIEELNKLIQEIEDCVEIWKIAKKAKKDLKLDLG